MVRYPWSEIKTKYETGKYSMQELADEYGFNRRYGSRKANEDNWQKGKSSNKVAKEAAKKAFDYEVDRESKIRKDYDELLNVVIKEYKKAFITNEDFERLKQCKIASEILRNCRKEHWEVNEIQEVAEKIEQKLDINQIPDINLVRGADE